MNYEAGVRYETHGATPNLPDDVKVEAQTSFGAWIGADKVSRFYWPNLIAFKLVEKMESNRVGHIENWYVRGKLPPEGAYCQVLVSGGEKKSKWKKCRILWVGKSSIVWVSESGEENWGNFKDVIFSPIKSEFDKQYEFAMANMTTARISNSQIKTIKRMLELGFRAEIKKEGK